MVKYAQAINKHKYAKARKYSQEYFKRTPHLKTLTANKKW